MRYLINIGPWLGVVVGGAWLMAVRPAHSKGAATVLVLSLTLALTWLIVRGLVTLSMRRNDRIRKTSDVAAAALARDGFTVVDGLLGDRCQDMIAIDDQKRVALCDLGPGGTVLRTRIVAADQVHASSIVNDHGGTSLLVNVAGERRAFVFAARRPTHDDRPDLAEQARITDGVRWWCERLSGRQPVEPFRVSLSVGSRAYGQAFDAALGRELAARGLTDVPAARVVRP